MTGRAQIVANKEETTRETRVRAAFCRGGELTLENPSYVDALRGIGGELLRQDSREGDLTAIAMGFGARRCAVEIRTKESGVAAGIFEAAWLYEREEQTVEHRLRDGEPVTTGDALLRVEGDAAILLALERTVVNLLQRMSGIATTTRKLVATAQSVSPNAHVVATRKTLWGLLDKRAVHCGGGGTHRLSLSDAILIKTNHLRLIQSDEAANLEDAIARGWENRQSATFFEVEVATQEEALAAARMLSSLHVVGSECPCILMLDNFSPADAKATVAALRDAGLYENVLVEASGNVSDASVAAYAGAGVDAISVGALTHSAHALDLSARLIPEVICL